MPLSARVLVAATAVVLLAGCGSQTLQQQSKSLKALAAEGGVLAGEAAHGRATATFTRQHGGFLVKSARSSASALARQSSVEGRRLARLAARIAADLERLVRSGGDRAEQARLERDLERIAARL